MAKKTTPTPICPYCNTPAIFCDSSAVYHGTSYGMIWLCPTCKAYVGVHKGTDRPLGRLADKILRDWKIQAHAVFDVIWKERARLRQLGLKCGSTSGMPGGKEYKPVYSRIKAYGWLAQQLGIEREECHIGMFDVEMCQRVVEICKPIADKILKGATNE